MMSFPLALWLGWTLKSSLVLGVALIGVRLGKNKLAPNIRFALLFIGLFSFILIPLFEIFLPALWTIWVTPISVIDSQELGRQAIAVAASSIPSGNGVTLEGQRFHSMELWMIIWALGMVWGSYRFGLRLFNVGKLARQAKSLDSGNLVLQVKRIANQLGLKRQVPVKLSSQIEMPQAWGPPRAFILLPEQAVGWSTNRLQVVLAHELAHCQRWDALSSCLLRMVQIVQWFNPLVLWAARQAAFEQELAADAKALSTGIHRCDYSGELVALAKSLRPPMPRVASTMTLLGQHGLHERVSFLLNSRKAHVSRIPQCLALLGSACFLLFSSFMGQIQATPASRSSPALANLDDSVDPVMNTLFDLFMPDLEERREAITQFPRELFSPILEIPNTFSLPKKVPSHEPNASGSAKVPPSSKSQPTQGSLSEQPLGKNQPQQSKGNQEPGKDQQAPDKANQPGDQESPSRAASARKNWLNLYTFSLPKKVPSHEPNASGSAKVPPNSKSQPTQGSLSEQPLGKNQPQQSKGNQEPGKDQQALNKANQPGDQESPSRAASARKNWLNLSDNIDKDSQKPIVIRKVVRDVKKKVVQR